MIPTGQLLTHHSARKTKRQHKTPCSDCPWSRKALAGWLGTLDVDGWIRVAHGDGKIECHTTNQQCAGAAIYRANVCKSVNDPDILHLPANKAIVLAWLTEFKEHHMKPIPLFAAGTAEPKITKAMRFRCKEIFKGQSFTISRYGSTHSYKHCYSYPNSVMAGKLEKAGLIFYLPITLYGVKHRLAHLTDKGREVASS